MRLTYMWTAIPPWLRWTGGLLLLPLVGLGLLYWGYCWGWWGRNSLVLQYAFQCRSPQASEVVRYQPLRVLASACNQPRLRDMSPSGRFLLIEPEQPINHLRRLDLLANQAAVLPLDAEALTRVHHLSDTLLFTVRRYSLESQIIDVENGAKADLVFVKSSSKLEPSVLSTLGATEEVVIIGVYTIGLMPDALHNPDQSIVIYAESPAYQSLLTKQLTEQGIPYQELLPPYTTGPVHNAKYSPDGRFYALPDGIYQAETGQRVIATGLRGGSDGFEPQGWTPDNRAVVYSAPTAYLVDQGGAPIFGGRFFAVPQPILLLELPTTNQVRAVTGVDS